jgi:hypothetical protein
VAQSWLLVSLVPRKKDLSADAAAYLVSKGCCRDWLAGGEK